THDTAAPPRSPTPCETSWLCARSDDERCDVSIHGAIKRSTNPSERSGRTRFAPDSGAQRSMCRFATCNARPAFGVMNAGPARAAVSARGSLVSVAIALSLRELQSFVRDLEGLDHDLALRRVHLGHVPLARPAGLEAPRALHGERGVEHLDRAVGAKHLAD